MIKALQFFFLFTMATGFSQSLPLSQDATVSVITIGPGSNLNDAFGHNAIRVKSRFSDITYDFGRYDFDAPGFYLNFARGKLNYLQGKSNYNHFIAIYRNENRTIKEQQLQLTTAEKQNLYDYLETNYKNNQGAYLYDFFYDNCATKIRDAIETTLAGNLIYNLPDHYKEQTFRQLIDANLNWNTWGSFGIDIALGSIIDRTATPREQLFLPEYVNQNFETATLKDSSQKLVVNSKTIYTKKGDNENKTSSFLTSPLLVMILVGGFIIFITFKDFKNKVRSKWLDLALFITTGVIGVLLFLLWFATDHTGTAYNYNVLWAFPLSLFCVLQIVKTVPKKWFIAYIKFSILMLCLLVMHWTIGVQRFAPALIPLLLALLVRYIFLLKHYKLAAV
ncbi:DUF4105 domain-containing protein [Olleya sp. HaHaR_3_96]|uniref:lipoprotein N-acyltransferase Lnb domain-containing protein n=1 Tax=Olleya sp. HaHaR_3_96 TaxID=2745560 RepID=UPI001C4E6FCC|nr:DUF4105 domain-containing protein [Olleya sp. HaHaR_3_96]QXP61702.1 DUF4105 domain-containing protein [Olleya sp. HaHaR_3_96]